jgi:L-amino acid N-acyltransferase YncA
MTIRSATSKDAAACAAIYAPYVVETAISFEEAPPPAEQMAERIAAAHAWLVAESGDGAVAGYAYGSPHAERAAYRWTADVAIYLAPAHHRRGLGRALYEELFARLRDGGLCMLCAGVTLPNPASERLHLALGFEEVGTYRRIGYKLGAWHDVRWYQLDLRPGEHRPPPG